MRISGGIHRGRVLEAPPGLDVRPASDMIRQAVFNILGPRIEDAAVLDLFAGTGSLGLESLSRGAASVTFVERDRRVADVLRRNAATLGCADRAKVLSFDLLSQTARLRDAGGPFEIVFVAPPYPMMQSVDPGSGVGALLMSLFAEGHVKPGGVLILQHDRRTPIAEVWPGAQITDRRNYGKTLLTFFEPAAPGGAP